MSDARVRVSVVDGTIEIEGTEAFVGAQLEKFGESIRAGLAAEHTIAAKDTIKDAGAAAQPDTGIDLTGIFTVTDRGAVHIAADIPGDSRWERIANAGKLLAYGAARLRNRRTVLFAEVRAVCRAHRCYDQKNLATVLKKHRSAFVFGGRGRKQTLALTESGTKEVETMLKTLGAARSPASAA